MKLVVSWAPNKTGEALGWLVGMLTLGTALPHLVRGLGTAWSWQSVVLTSSGLALIAAVMIAALGDGPHLAAARVRASGSAKSCRRSASPTIAARRPAISATCGNSTRSGR